MRTSHAVMRCHIMKGFSMTIHTLLSVVGQLGWFLLFLGGEHLGWYRTVVEGHRQRQQADGIAWVRLRPRCCR